MASADRHAQRRNRVPFCIEIPLALQPAEIACLARAHLLDGVVVQSDPETLPHLRDQLPDIALGAYSRSGHWVLPPGATHVYFLGSWRLITVAMLREAARGNVVSLVARCSGGWIDIPLAFLRTVAGRRHWLRASLARLPSFASRGRSSFISRWRWEESIRSVNPPRLRRMLATVAAEATLCPVPGRVLQVCGNLSPGGAERQVAYTACGLNESPKIESCAVLCDFLTPGSPARYDFYLPLLAAAKVPARMIERRFYDPAAVRSTPGLREGIKALPAGLLLDVANLYTEFVRLRPEIVHAWLDWSNIRAGLAAALAGVPRILLSGRNLSPPHFALYQPYMDPIYRILCTLPNVVLLNNSEAGARDYASWLGLKSERISVIHNGFDTSSARPTATQVAEMREQLGIPDHGLLVGGVFRLSEEKQPLLWIETAAQVSRRCPSARFVLFGDGPMRESVERLARQVGIHDRLTMPGVSTEVFTAMCAMDVFLLTSYGEGVPNVLIEAQLTGTPIVTTAVGGAPEAVDNGRTGWAVEGASPDILADRVLSVLRDVEWRDQVRTLGPEFVQRKFGMERMLRETLAVYFPQHPPS